MQRNTFIVGVPCHQVTILVVAVLHDSRLPRCAAEYIPLLCFKGELFKVETVEADRIRVDRVWNKRGSKRVLLYKMVLNPRQKIILG